MGTILTLLTTLGGPLISLIGKLFGGSGDQDQRELGRAEQKTTDQAAALDAHKRMDKAAAMPSDTAKGLQDGTF